MARNIKICILSCLLLFALNAADKQQADGAKQPEVASDNKNNEKDKVKTVDEGGKGDLTPVRFDPLQQSAEEDIKVFIELSKRDQELRKREQELKKETLLLRAAETSLDEKLKQFNILKTDLDKLLKRLEDHENKQTADLVKMYESMKAKQAAVIFNKIDLMLAIQILKRMNKKKSALLLAAMDSQKAKDITQGLAKESQNIALVK